MIVGSAKLSSPVPLSRDHYAARDHYYSVRPSLSTLSHGHVSKTRIPHLCTLQHGTYSTQCALCSVPTADAESCKHCALLISCSGFDSCTRNCGGRAAIYKYNAMVSMPSTTSVTADPASRRSNERMLVRPRCCSQPPQPPPRRMTTRIGHARTRATSLSSVAAAAETKSATSARARAH